MAPTEQPQEFVEANTRILKGLYLEFFGLFGLKRCNLETPFIVFFCFGCLCYRRLVIRNLNCLGFEVSYFIQLVSK